MYVIRHGGLVELSHAALLSSQTTGEVTKMVNRQWDVGVQGLTHALTVIPAFRDGEHFKVLLHTVGNTQQYIAAFGRSRFAPSRRRAVGCIQCQVNIGRV